MDDYLSRAFACEFCDKRFTSKHFLQRHYASHTDDRSHLCEICGRGYKYRKGLNRHYKKIHYDSYRSRISERKPKEKKIVAKRKKQSTEKPVQKPLDCFPDVKTAEEDLYDFHEGMVDDEYCFSALEMESKIFTTSPFPP
jgi:hypothetical protein